MRGNEESFEREDRPSNTSDGRDVRELEPRWMEEGEMKGEIEDEVMEEEKEMRESQRRLLSPLKVPDSIETILLDSKLQNDGKE